MIQRAPFHSTRPTLTGGWELKDVVLPFLAPKSIPESLCSLAGSSFEPGAVPLFRTPSPSGIPVEPLAVALVPTEPDLNTPEPVPTGDEEQVAGESLSQVYLTILYINEIEKGGTTSSLSGKAYCSGKRNPSSEREDCHNNARLGPGEGGWLQNGAPFIKNPGGLEYGLPGIKPP